MTHADEYDVHVCAHAWIATGAGPWPVRACFLYDLTDPVAVGLHINPGYLDMECIDWTFARALLDEAFAYPNTPRGQGDVRFHYDLNQDVLIVSLATNDANGFVPITIEGAPVIAFMSQSLGLIPTANEDVTVDDAEIAHLMESE